LGLQVDTTASFTNLSYLSRMNDLLMISPRISCFFLIGLRLFFVLLSISLFVLPFPSIFLIGIVFHICTSVPSPLSVERMLGSVNDII